MKLAMILRKQGPGCDASSWSEETGAKLAEEVHAKRQGIWRYRIRRNGNESMILLYANRCFPSEF
eukprot:764872-Hanusia_phi.AAC.1